MRRLVLAGMKHGHQTSIKVLPRSRTRVDAVVLLFQ